MSSDHERRFRSVVWTVAVLNLAYFGIEFAVARSIESVSLFADSIDFLEDASINFLIVLALGWHPVTRAKIGMVLAGIILVPGIATLWSAWEKFYSLTPPYPLPLSLTGAGALAVNFSCALMLSPTRHKGGSLAKAAFLSARNDVLANVAIIAAAALTAVTYSGYPDLMVGLGIALLNADAAREVYSSARNEHRDAVS